MRISVEMEDKMIEQIMEMTGERKMSTAIAKAAEMFMKRQKAVTMIRSLREEPMDYGQTNEELEAHSDPESPALLKKPMSYRQIVKEMDKANA